MKRTRHARDIVAFADHHSYRVRVFSWNVSWESTKPSPSGFGRLGDAARRDVAAIRRLILEIVHAEDADIVALQETPIEWKDNLLEDFRRNGYNVHFLHDITRFGPEGMLTAWKSSLVPGVTPIVVEESFEGRNGRPITTIDFGSKLVLVNIHAGHDYKVARFQQTLNILKPRENVIVCGDFNRPIKLLAFGRGALRLRNCANEPLLTCCSQDESIAHELAYDHILTDLSIYVPTRIAARRFPTSDHLPIVADVTMPAS